MDRDLQVASQDASKDLSTWAAYAIGYHLGLMPMSLQFPRMAPDFGQSCFDALPVTAFQIRLACDILAGHLPAGVVYPAREVANELESINNEAAIAFHNDGRLDWDVESVRHISDRLPVLFRKLVTTEAELRPWFELGRCLGAFISVDPTQCGQPAVPFRPVVDAVRKLRKSDRELLRELREIALLIDLVGSEGEAGLRRRYVARLATNWPDDAWDPWPNSPFFTQEILDLHHRIDNHLRSLPTTTPPISEEPVPNWDRAAGILFIRGKTIRTVAIQAHRVREVLDRFQSKSWPAYIETEIKDDEKKKTVKSMNRNLIEIEFFCSGTRTGIGWRARSAK